MSKRFVLSSMVMIGLASSAQAMDMPAVRPYVDVHLGVVDKNQQAAAEKALSAGLSDSNSLSAHNMDNVLTVGGDAGLQLGRFLGVEGGGFYFQNGTVTALQNTPSSHPIIDQNQQVKYKSWVGYLAMKAKAPLMKMLDVYGKVGAGYESQSAGLLRPADASPTGSGVSMGSFHSWVPVFSVGLEDHITKSLSLNFQYTHLADGWRASDNKDAKHGSGADQFKHKNILTMSLGYLFKL